MTGTTQKFGNGTLTRWSDGTTTRTQPMGSGIRVTTRSDGQDNDRDGSALRLRDPDPPLRRFHLAHPAVWIGEADHRQGAEIEWIWGTREITAAES